MLRNSYAQLKRGNRLDIIRLLLTVGIVLRHATNNNLQPVVVVTEVCVPLFFVLSGYLFFRNAPQYFRAEWFWGKIRSRIFSLLIPYVIANIIAWLCFYFAMRFAPSMVSGFFGDDWKDPIFVFWKGPVNMSLWFIRELMIVVVLSPLVYLLLRYTGWLGVLALGVLWAFGAGPAPVFFFSAGGCLGMRKIAPVEQWLHKEGWAPVQSRGWTYFVYLYHYLLLIGVKKGLAMLLPYEGIVAQIAVWVASALIVLAVITGVFCFMTRFTPRLLGVIIGGK